MCGQFCEPGCPGRSYYCLHVNLTDVFDRLGVPRLRDMPWRLPETHTDRVIAGRGKSAARILYEEEKYKRWQDR